MKEELPNPYVVKGYSYYTLEEFISELEEWDNQIREGEESNANVGEMVYYELIDWFEDNISPNKDEDFIYPITAAVDRNGKYNVTKWET